MKWTNENAYGSDTDTVSQGSEEEDAVWCEKVEEEMFKQLELRRLYMHEEREAILKLERKGTVNSISGMDVVADHWDTDGSTG